MKIRLEEEKVAREQGALMEEMLAVQEAADKAAHMEADKEVEISIDDYDFDGDASENDGEFTMEELQDF